MSRVEVSMPRRRWPWIVAAIVAAIVIALLILNLTSGVGAGSGPTAAPTPTQTTVAPAGPDQGQPTGCLGGKTRDFAMLAAAQESATHSSYGAVEFVAAMVRWGFRYPTPTGDEADKVQAGMVSSSPSFTQTVRESMESYRDPIVPPGTPYYLSTLPGVWNIEQAAPDQYTVTVGTAYVINEQLTKYRDSVTYTVVWEDGAWKISGAQQLRSTDTLFAIGTTFLGGC